MFDIHKLADKTSYFYAFSNVGIVEVGDGEVVLIDTCDHTRMIRTLDRLLAAKNLSVKTVINTHCHVDHIMGNKYFQDKYGCNLLSTKLEKTFIAYPDLEPKFYFSGIETDKNRNPFFMVEGTETDIITKENTPEGFEIIPLPGHSFEMIGVRTPDDVVFLADAILSKRTWDEYKLPFFYNVNHSLETLEKIKDMKAAMFVPSHDEPTDNIRELAEYNIHCMRDKKELIFDICEGLSFDDIFAVLIDKLGVSIKTPKYTMYAIMLRNFLQSLVEDKRIYGKLEDDMKYIYYHK